MEFVCPPNHTGRPRRKTRVWLRLVKLVFPHLLLVLPHRLRIEDPHLNIKVQLAHAHNTALWLRV